MQKSAVAFSDAVVDMSVKVYKTDGTVQELKGIPVNKEVSIPKTLIDEYKLLSKEHNKIVNRLREIEQEILSKAIKE